MRGFQSVLAAFCACGLLAACASAPISLVGSGVTDAGLRSNPQQAALLDATQTLEAGYRDNGWVRTAGAMETARGWMDRLAGQPASETASANQPAESYIEQRQLLVLDSAAATEILTADLVLATSQARHVEQAARVIILQPAEFNRATLTRDLGEVETAIALTREAVANFDAAITRVSVNLSTGQMSQVHSERDHLAYLSESLRDCADDLARLRRETRDARLSS